MRRGTATGVGGFPEATRLKASMVTPHASSAGLPGIPRLRSFAGIHRLPLLSAQEAAFWTSEVLQERQAWTRRGSGCFFSLGAAAYMDVLSPDQYAQYLRKARTSNRVLAGRFRPLLVAVAKCLKQVLCPTPVGFGEPWGLPGFHIWETSAIPSKNGASRHYDLQFRSLDHSHYQEVDTERPWTFTMLLRLPAAGALLHVWDLPRGDTRLRPSIDFEARDRRLQTTERYDHHYVAGEVLFHDGLLLHQIGAVPVVPGDLRVALQGHALLCDGVWRLYW